MQDAYLATYILTFTFNETKNKGILDLLPEHTYCNTVTVLMICTIKMGKN